MICRNHIFLLCDHSLRSMAIVLLNPFANGNPTTGRGLVFLSFIQISQSLSRSVINNINSFSSMPQQLIIAINYITSKQLINYWWAGRTAYTTSLQFSTFPMS